MVAEVTPDHPSRWTAMLRRFLALLQADAAGVDRRITYTRPDDGAAVTERARRRNRPVAGAAIAAAARSRLTGDLVLISLSPLHDAPPTA